MWVGAKKRAPDRTKKPTRKKDEPPRRGLTKKAPYKWARHVGKVVRVIGGGPLAMRVAASTSHQAAVTAGVGQGRRSVEAG